LFFLQAEGAEQTGMYQEREYEEDLKIICHWPISIFPWLSRPQYCLENLL
jgi:hypothetical protein